MSSTHVSVEQGNNELTDRNTRSVRCIESSRGNDRVVFSVVPIDRFDSSFSDSLDSVRDEVDIGFDEGFEVSRPRSQSKHRSYMLSETERDERDCGTRGYRRQATGKVGMSFSAI